MMNGSYQQNSSSRENFKTIQEEELENAKII